MKNILVLLFLGYSLCTYSQDTSKKYTYREITKIVRKGNIPLLKTVLDEVNLNKLKSSTDLSLLYYACSSGNLEMTKFLINKGYTPNTISKYGCPANWAAEKGHIEIIDYLLDNGFNPKIEEAAYWVDKYNSDDNSTPNWIQDEVKKIIENGINYNNDAIMHYTDPSDNLILANTIMFDKGAKKNIARKIISMGVNVNLKNKYGLTALHYSIILLNPIYVKQLIKNGADVNMPIYRKNTYSKNPLINDNVTPLCFLLQMIIDKPEKLDEDLDEILDIAKQLIKAGSDFTQKRTSNQQTPIDLVKQINNKKLNRLFRIK